MFCDAEGRCTAADDRSISYFAMQKDTATHHGENWLEVPEPSATNLACVARLMWGVEWRGDLVDLASKSHRVIRVVT